MSIKQEFLERIRKDMPIKLFDNSALTTIDIRHILTYTINEYIEELIEENFDFINNVKYEYLSELQKEFPDFDVYEYEHLVEVDVQGWLNPLKNTNIVCFIKVLSAFDCTNSFDKFSHSDYLQQVYKRVNEGVKLDDYLFEHSHGAYGDSVFTFAVRMPLFEYMQIRDNINNFKKVKIPKGTQFSFYSAWYGSAGTFTSTTHKDLILNLRESDKVCYTTIDNEVYRYDSNYDKLSIISDIESGYTIRDIFGNDEFIIKQKLKFF